MSSGVSACNFASAEPFAGHCGLTPCVPFPRCCRSVRAGGRVKERAYGLAASGGTAGILDAGDYWPIIGAAVKGHAAAGGSLCGCGGPTARPGAAAIPPCRRAKPA